MILRVTAAILAIAIAIEAIEPEILHIRAKRQPCRCVRDVSLQNSLTCGCQAPVMIPGAPLAVAQYQQQLALATQLQYVQPLYQSCGCVPVMYLANPIYSCSCNGETTAPTTVPPATVPTTTLVTQPTVAPTTTTTTVTPPPYVETSSTTTPTTTTTTTPTTTTTTTTTTPAPTTVTTTPSTTTSTTTLPTTTTTFMAIPETSTTTTTPAPTTSAPCVYPPVATVNSTQQGCFCLDVSTQVVQPLCGCRCDCYNGLSSVPNGVCSCPQASPTAPVTAAPVPIQAHPTQSDSSMYPLTTTCVIQIGIPQQSSGCNCLPQYNNCAPNICCLKPAFRSYKKTHVASEERSAIDTIIDLLKSMKNVY